MSRLTFNERLERTPGWIQDHVISLNRVIEQQRNRIAELSNAFIDSEGQGMKPTLVKIHGFRLQEPDIPLPSDSDIEFTVTKQNRVSVTLRESQFTPGRMSLKVMGNGCDPLLIKMHASNSFEIVFDTERKL